MTAQERERRAAFYLRVSTLDQTTENQEAPLREWAARMGWTIVEVYKDTGVSGSKSSRAALNRMLKDARVGKFRMVLVARLDRLGRSLSHLLWVVQELDRLGVVLKDLHTGFDLSTSTGRLTLGILGSISQFERDLIIDRTKAGLARAKSQGRHCGRPRKEFDAEAARTMLAAGTSAADVANAMGVSRETLRMRLRSDGRQESPPAV